MSRSRSPTPATSSARRSRPIATSAAAARAASACARVTRTSSITSSSRRRTRYVMVFSDRGRAYWLKVHEIPDVGADGRGQGDRQPGADERRREDRGDAAGREFDDAALHRDGHARRHDQEDRTVGVQQPARRRHHRHGRRRERCRDVGAAVGRPERSVHRHPSGHGHPLPRERRARDGPHGLRRARHSAARGRRSGRGRSGEARRHAADGDPEGLRQAHAARRVPRPEPRRPRA